MNPIYDGSQKIHLIGSKTLRLLLEQRGILVDNILICRFKILLGSRFISMNSYQPRQLLHIRRVVIHYSAYSFSQLPRYLLARSFKTTAYIIYPIRCSYFRQINDISEFIERQAFLLEQFIHQMFLATEQTIRYRLLQLPHCTQSFLKCLGILELGNLLELVDTHNDIAAFLLRYFSGSCRISSTSLLLGFISSETDKSIVGSVPIEILGLI